MPPCGSLLLFLSNDAERGRAGGKAAGDGDLAGGPPEIRRVEPNVLTLDYVDVTAGGETLKNVYFYEAGQFAFPKNGMERNPWDSAVQFHDELISQEVPARKRFRGDVPLHDRRAGAQAAGIVIERPDLYTITCNGKPVRPPPGQWWLDKAFGKIDICGGRQDRRERGHLKASPLTIYHEMESAYVLGDFSLKATDSGFVIAPPTPLTARPRLERAGQPVLCGGRGLYRDVRRAEARRADIASRCRPSGTAAWPRCRVNGKPAGYDRRIDRGSAT